MHFAPVVVCSITIIIIIIVRRRDVGLVTANERHSGVDVVHGCFMEGGDSNLSVELLRAKL